MSVVFGKFEMPESITVEKGTSEVTARFVAEPFERGFAHTFGNSFRRILLSSLEAPAIISVCIEGVPHEYMAVEGIIEDVTNIILNFKCALLRKLPMAEEKGSRRDVVITKVLEVTSADLAKKGQVEVTLGDLIDEGNYEVVNSELHLFTVTQPMTRRIDIRVRTGRGYVMSERHDIPDRQENEIVIDAIFSPVRCVNYFVEDTRVGQDTDFDRLVLEITTDGRITPKEALSFSAQIGIRHFDVFEKIEEHEITFDIPIEHTDEGRDELLHKLGLGINEIELSVRSTNCLNGAGIQSIGELVVMTEDDMLKCRNFGKKSLTEIKNKLYEMNLSLGMDLSEWGIHSKKDIEEVLSQLNSEKEEEL